MRNLAALMKIGTQQNNTTDTKKPVIILSSKH